MENLAEKINKKIKNTKPIPKWEFIGWEIFKDTSVIILFILTVFLLGIAIYLSQNYNPWGKINLEPTYLWHSFLTTPWELFIVVIVLLTLIYLMARKIHFAYRFNGLVIIALIIILAGCGYLIAENVGVNQKLAEITPVKTIYQNQGRLVAKTRGVVTIGKIKAIENNNLIIIDDLGNTWTIIISKTNVLGDKVIRIGDVIIINGLKKGNIIEATIIKKMPESWRGKKSSGYFFQIIRVNI